MLGEEDKDKPPVLPPAPAGAAGDNRKTYSRSVSWAGRSPTKPNTSNPKSLWNSKARACLPPLQPLSVSRPKTEEWPRAGSDDVGVWPSVATTPGVRLKPPPLPSNLDTKLEKPEFEFKKDKLAFFDKECSRIIDHVYLGSDAVAKNRDVLRQNGITHVLNCVGFVCPEYFKNDLVYKTLWLQDSPSEDITSILYDVFDYFEDVRERNGRVFVHCCQGVSRSTSLVIAYLMWREGQSFEDAFQHVKAARGVTNPNMGFACQLLQCQKRVHAVPLSPNSVLRMYRMAPHSSYAPLHLVPKLLNQPNTKALDSRGAFIVQVPSAIYVWIGKNCVPLMSESASLAASQLIRYEKAKGPVLTIREGEELAEFWVALGNEKGQALEDIGNVGQRKIIDYDLDFGIFSKAAAGGVVPPLAMSENGSEMCLPARRSGWERLRRKFASGFMKELITSSLNSNQPCYVPENQPHLGLDITIDNSRKEVECHASPHGSQDSFSSTSPSQCWVNRTFCKEEDNSQCPSPDSFSSFLIQDSRKFGNTSPSLSPSTSDYSNSFTFSPTSSSWSDLSYLSAQPSPSGLETSNLDLNPNPNLEVEETCISLPHIKTPPSTAKHRDSNTPTRMILDEACQIPKNLNKSWSFSIEDKIMKDAEECLDESDRAESMCDAENRIETDDCYYDTCEGITEMTNSVLYQWPTMEKLEMDCLGIPDSRSVYIIHVASMSSGTPKQDVLYIWVGRDVSSISDASCKDGHTQWQIAGRDFLIRKGLSPSSLVQIIKEGEEPEQLWKHLHCFSFQNTTKNGHS